MTSRFVVVTVRLVVSSLLILWIAASLRLGPYSMTDGELLEGWIAQVADWEQSGILALTVVLIAVVQRPFWSRAGVRRHALRRSLIASVWAAPFVLASLIFSPRLGGGLCSAVISLPIWTLVHVACAKTRGWTDGGKIDWRILLLSNVAVLFGMYLATATFDALRPKRWSEVAILAYPPWQELRWGSFAMLSVLAAIAIVAAFSLPYRDGPGKIDGRDATPVGPENPP